MEIAIGGVGAFTNAEAGVGGATELLKATVAGDGAGTVGDATVRVAAEEPARARPVRMTGATGSGSACTGRANFICIAATGGHELRARYGLTGAEGAGLSSWAKTVGV